VTDGRFGYRDVADLLRDRITSGELQPGDRIPTERDLQIEYGVGRETARRAHRELAEEGLVDIRHGYPSRVRVPPERTEIRITRYSTLIVRLPTRQERLDHGLARGARMVEVTTSGKAVAYPDDRFYFTST
jgi:GntR family transcriptional regulator